MPVRGWTCGKWESRRARDTLFLTNKTNFMAKVSRNTGLDTGVGSRIPAAPGRRSGHRTKQFEGKSRLGGETCPHEFIILHEKKPAGRNSTIFDDKCFVIRLKIFLQFVGPHFWAGSRAPAADGDRCPLDRPERRGFVFHAVGAAEAATTLARGLVIRRARARYHAPSGG